LVFQEAWLVKIKKGVHCTPFLLAVLT